VQIPIAYVWHLHLFMTAAIVNTQSKLCEFNGENIAHFHWRSFGYCNIEQTQTTTVFLATILRFKVNTCSGIQSFPKTCGTVWWKYSSVSSHHPTL